MKRIICIIIILMAFIIPTSKFRVDADAAVEPGTNLGPGVVGDKHKPCSKQGNTFCYATELSDYSMRAIRTTMVDQNGKRLVGTRSVDYIKYDTNNSRTFFANLNNKLVNFYKYPNYKNAIVSSNGDFNGTWASGNYLTSNNHTIVKLPEHAFDKFVNTSTGVIKNYFLDITKYENGMFEDFFVPTFFEKMKYDLDAALVGEKYKNHAILVEPVVYFRLTSDRPGKNNKWILNYVGTPTEIANMLSSPRSQDINNKLCPNSHYYDIFIHKKFGGNGYCGYVIGGGQPFVQAWPLSIFATENRGGLNAVSGTGSDYSRSLLSRDALAAGHVWLETVVKETCPADPTKITTGQLPKCCDKLVDGGAVNSSNYGLCCDELYKKGKLQSSHLPVCCSSLPTSDPRYDYYCRSSDNECDWKIDASCPSSCFSGNTDGYVNDMTNWNCIFKSQNSANPNVKRHFFKWENQYCKVFCREEINYQLPQNNFTVRAGYHFTVGYNNEFTWEPIVFNGKKECRTTSDIGKIKVDQFKEDYKNTNDELPALWNAYLASRTSTNLNKFNAKKRDRDQLLFDIKSCTNWDENNNSFLPSLSLRYEEGNYGVGSLALKNNVNSEKYTDFYIGSNSKRNAHHISPTIRSYNCSGTSACVSSSVSYPAHDKVIQVHNKEVKYELPTNTYRYVIKSDGTSTSIRPGAEYTDIGYSNLPVHYTRASGQYDISLEYGTFGNGNKFNSYVFGGVSFAAGKRISCGTSYQCNYEVDNRIITIEDNLNVMFRPVSLSNPFPGTDGKGRTPGSNWKNNEHIITKNRGLNDPEKIYTDKEPMYEIKLTPALIKEIRRYNRAQEGGYGNFTLTCNLGSKCRSKFIRNNFKQYFSGCGVSENWDACK